jgi:hypothetical protein
MNRRVLASVAVVVAVNAYVLVGVVIDRSGGPLECINLTERELILSGISEDNTGVALRLAWSHGKQSGWQAEDFDSAKLAELGFDVSVPPGAPEAVQHYRKQSARQVFAVLEYGEPRDALPASTRLVVVDAGRDYGALRRRYSDQSRYLIVPALVRIGLHYSQTKPDAIAGSVVMLLVNQIHVPQPCAATLAGLRNRGRYTITLCYGKRFHPWIRGCAE